MTAYLSMTDVFLQRYNTPEDEVNYKLLQMAVLDMINDNMLRTRNSCSYDTFLERFKNSEDDPEIIERINKLLSR